MKKSILILLTISLIAIIFSSCGAASQGNQITASGSSALKPLVDEAVKMYKKINSNTSIIVNAGGSGEGLKQVSNKTVDIGNSDVFAIEKLPADQAKNLVDHKVCVVGVAAVVNNAVTVSNLTSQQLTDIFTGKITNWKDVGGNDLKIVVINRPAASGTRALFKQYALNNKEEATGLALSEDNSGVLAQTVAQTNGAIAYLALSYTKNNTGVKTLKLNGIEPTYDNIYKGTYPVWGYEHMYTNGQPGETVKAFLGYITGNEFASKIEELGYGVTSKMTVTRPDPEIK